MTLDALWRALLRVSWPSFVQSSVGSGTLPKAVGEGVSGSRGAVVATSHDVRPGGLGGELMYAKEAAGPVGVKPAVVLQWARRGRLRVAARDGHKRPLFLPADVAEAERATRTVARRRHPDLADVLSGVVESAECVPLDPAELDRLVSSQDAAALAGVADSTIRSWVSRKHLRPAVDDSGISLVDDRGRALFRVRDVAAAEAVTSKRARTRARRPVSNRRGGTPHNAASTIIERRFEGEV